MEGILLDIESVLSPYAALSGLALLGIVTGGIILGYMADEEKDGKKVFWAESPFTDVSEEAPAEKVKYLRAA